MQVRVPFVQTPVAASYFQGIQNWKTDNATAYLKEKVLPRIAANLVFLGFALVTLIAFLLWRLIRSFIMCCCPEAAPALFKDPVVVTRSGPVVFGKLVIFAFAIGIYVTAIVGLALSDNTLVNQVFLQVDAVTGFGDKVVGNLTNVALAVNAVTPVAQSLITNSGGLPSQAVTSITQAANDIKAQVSSASGVVNPASNSVSSILNSVNSTRSSTGSQVNQYYDIAVKVSQGLCGAAMLFSIGIVLFSVIHCPAGIALSVFVNLIFTCLFFLLGIIFALIMVAQVDTCANLEPIVTITASSQLQPVLAYYLSSTQPSQNLEQVIASAGLFNLTDVRAQLVNQINTSVASLNSQISSMPSSYQSTYTSLANTLTSASTNIVNAIGFSSPASGLIGLISWVNVWPLYSSVKGSFCCVVLDQFTFFWSIFTALGWLLMTACWAAMGLLGTLDKLPRSGWCCTCSCLTPNKVASITIDDDQPPPQVMVAYQSPPSQMVMAKPHPSQMVMVPAQEAYPGPSRHQSVTYVSQAPQGYYPAVPVQGNY
jgi:hypothetical protein